MIWRKKNSSQPQICQFKHKLKSKRWQPGSWEPRGTVLVLVYLGLCCCLLWPSSSIARTAIKKPARRHQVGNLSAPHLQRPAKELWYLVLMSYSHGKSMLAHVFVRQQMIVTSEVLFWLRNQRSTVKRRDLPGRYVRKEIKQATNNSLSKIISGS